MLDAFIGSLPIPGGLEAITPHLGDHDLRLVALAVGVAMLGAFAALTLGEQIAASAARGTKLIWSAVGGGVLGGGVWAMHFIAMLAFSLPCGVAYDPWLTLLSMVPCIAASGIALFIMGQREILPQSRLLACAGLIGGGVGMMHYSGMAAMRADALLRFDSATVALSIVVALGVAYLALVFRSWLIGLRCPVVLRNALVAAVMGTAVAGMHFTAMQAAIFYPLPGGLLSATAETFPMLAMTIAVVAALVALCTLGVTFTLQQRKLAGSLLAEIALRQQSEAQARSERARLQAVFDAAVDAIVTIDSSGRIMQWSAGARRMFGYAPEDVIGRNVTILMPEPHRTRHAKYVGAYLGTGQAKIIGIGRELVAVRQDGSEFPMELAVSEVRADGDAFFTGIMRDITERKREQQDLVRAREEAEAANAAKSQFLATMSHEIRTPLNGVVGMANLLSSTALDARQNRLVGNLSRSGQALLAIINDVLDLSKIEAGRLDLFETDFDPREVVADVADLFSERCTAKGLELVHFVAEDVPDSLKGDPGRLRQILVNLVGNAMKFTERGEILIELGVARSDESEVVLSFAVEDTGVGIPADKRPQVFQPFRQVDRSVSRSRGGTGLGLAISRQLVELMGGSIGVDSEPGHGSRFHFTLRCRRSAAGREQRTPRRFERPLRVLAVDINAVSAHVLSLYLSLWGIDATFVSTARAAEDAWEEEAARGRCFDAVILDIKGLAEAGIELGRKIRADKRGRPAEVVFLIGMDRFVADKNLESVDAIATLTKPIRPSELFNSLAAVASATPASNVTPFYVRRNARAQKPYFDARILVAEDNPVNQDVAAGVLENMGCRIVTAPNGAVAARLLAQEKFDLLLMDCEMPQMDGFEATRRIRQLEKMTGALDGGEDARARTPIVALTAHALADVRQKCLDAGMDDFLVKPFDEMHMSEVLRRWIGHLERAPTEKEKRGVPQRDVPFAAQIAPEDAPIDRAALSSVGAFKGANGPELLKRVVTRFVDTAPRLAVALREKCAQGDAEECWRAAHSLKSSSAALGALQLSRRCAEIEGMAKTSGIAPVLPLLDSLDSELAAAVSALTAMIGESDGPSAKRG